jgi:hypothetical protein
MSIRDQDPHSRCLADCKLSLRDEQNRVLNSNPHSRSSAAIFHHGMIKPPVDLDSFARSKEPDLVFDLLNGHGSLLRLDCRVSWLKPYSLSESGASPILLFQVYDLFLQWRKAWKRDPKMEQMLSRKKTSPRDVLSERKQRVRAGRAVQI